MTNYYVKQNNQIILFDTDKQKLQGTLDFIPQLKNVSIEQTDKEIIFLNNAFVFKDEVTSELAELEKQQQREQLLSQINELDMKRIRAVCEPSLKDENTTWLEYYNSQVAEIRNKLSLL